MRKTVAVFLVAAVAWAQGETDTPDTDPKKPELHKIYVPYKKLDELLGTDKERVMVPYKEFLELWSLKYGPGPDASKPPVPFAVESAAYEGGVAEGVAAFKVVISVEVFVDTWLRIPLDFRGVAFEEVLVDGEPGVIVPTRHGYDLVLRGKGRHKVEARFVAGIAKGKEFATTAFSLPSVPLHKLTFRVPGKGTEIKIDPARAHTSVTEGNETVLLAFLGPQRGVKMTWRYQPEEVDTEPPLIFATDQLDLKVQERIQTGRIRFDLEILRSPARGFSVRIPEKIQVLEVIGNGIKTWGFADQARRVLKVVLHKPVTGRYTLTVGFEGPVEVPGTLAVPAFAVEGATRERGFVRISSAEGVGLRPVATENVFQVDLNSLPKPIRGGARALGFRFPALPFSLTLRTERIAPLVSLVTRARLLVDRHTVKLDEELQFTVERAGIFGLTLEVPDGIVLTQVGDPRLVDSYRESKEGEKRVLTIALKRRVMGRFTLPFKAVAKLDLASGKLTVPLLKVRDVGRQQGTLGVFLHQGIKAVAKTKAAVPVEPRKHRRVDRFRSELPLAFAWRWRGGDIAVDFDVEARKPKVTCDVRYSLQAMESRVDVRADLAYTVQYTGVEVFRFRLPKLLADKIKKVDAPNLREYKQADDKVEEGKPPTVTFTVSLQSPALGAVAVSVEYTDVFPSALKVNQARPTRVPAIEPLDVERTFTHVAIRKAPTIKVDATSDDYEEIDPSELPKQMRSDDVFLALRRFDKPTGLLVGLTKYEYQPVADIVIRHVHLRTVIKDDASATTNAFFQVLNNNRQFLAVRLPEGSVVLDLMVEGKPKKPRVGGDGILLIQLPTGLAKDATFLIGMAYTHPIETSGGLFDTTAMKGPVLPAHEDAPAPFQALLTWSVHYPADWRITRFGGNVEATGDAAEQGTWLRRAVDSLGRTIQIANAYPGRRRGPELPLEYFKDVVPTPKQRNSVEAVFINGTGNGELAIHHTSTTMQVILVILGAVIGFGLVIGMSRAFKPLLCGGAVALFALLALAFAGPGSAPYWNGKFFMAAALTLLLMVVEKKRSAVRS